MFDGARSEDPGLPPLHLDRLACSNAIVPQMSGQIGQLVEMSGQRRDRYRLRWCRAAEWAAFVFAVLVVIGWIVVTP